MSANNQRKIFAIVGAGPKGLAVAIKAKVLREFGFPVEQVILIEKNQVAAHWSGEFGYTNGEMKLGTPPEKDLVFPIETDVGDNELNMRIRQRLLHFSWTSFLTHTGLYADWIDNGRHAPSHLLWARYMRWVANQLTPDVSILHSEVKKIDLSLNRKRWHLTLSYGTNQTQTLVADRLMLTGPGKPKHNFIIPASDKPSSLIYDAESFWLALKKSAFPITGHLAIIGAGENAASILLALSQYAPKLQIDIITPTGNIATRAENYHENKFYSQPKKNAWNALTLDDRLNFINRTDLGVFSVQATNLLSDGKIKPHIVSGNVTEIKDEGKSASLNLNYHQKITSRSYDKIILATGFDQVAMLKSLLSPYAEKNILNAIDSPLTHKALAEKIDTDLSIRGMRPYLHLPMLASLMQGPGFANLSCLGLLSDRVIIDFTCKQTSRIKQDLIPNFLKAQP